MSLCLRPFNIQKRKEKTPQFSVQMLKRHGFHR
jgi:hypothetical protein